MRDLKITMTALVTPFQRNAVDFASLKRLVHHQLDHGVEGFVVHGTTGESPTVNETEKEKIFSFIKKIVPTNFPLVVGTGENSTEKTIQNTKNAKSWGADAALVVVPYYNKPPQRGLIAHFKAVAENGGLPVLLYNVPGRTVTTLDLESILELSKVPQIIGIKEASGNIHLAENIHQKCGEKFILLSGDDGTYADFLRVGGHGVISVASHILPKEFSSWRILAKEGKLNEVSIELKKQKMLIDSLFIEANPIPVKKALCEMGIIQSAELRLPMVEMDPQKAQEMRGLMKNSGLLK